MKESVFEILCSKFANFNNSMNTIKYQKRKEKKRRIQMSQK